MTTRERRKCLDEVLPTVSASFHHLCRAVSGLLLSEQDSQLATASENLQKAWEAFESYKKAVEKTLPNILIIAFCANGHTQTITIDHGLGVEYATVQAGLLDGSSSFYSHPPDQTSSIGKCGICGMQINCEVKLDEPQETLQYRRF
jgi:hypothetical protein